MNKNIDKKTVVKSYNDFPEKVKEAYKTIRANLVLSLIKDGCKKIVITSSDQIDGKTTSAVNLAISLAQIEQRVLLIDCNLREPNVYNYFNLSNSSGLTNVILKTVSFYDAVQKTEYEHLSVLTAGDKVDNSSEMLASSNLKTFIDSISEGYDYIIIDTPPLSKFSDSLPLAQFSDGVILVVRQHNTKIKLLEKTVKNLEFIKAKVLGFIYIGDEEK